MSDPRSALALDAAHRLAPRLGRLLPEAVERALSGDDPPRSALDGLARHLVRVVDAVLDGAPIDGDEAAAALVGGLPRPFGASSAIGRAVAEEVFAARRGEAASAA